MCPYACHFLVPEEPRGGDDVRAEVQGGAAAHLCRGDSEVCA